jgi:hypothetical protein
MITAGSYPAQKESRYSSLSTPAVGSLSTLPDTGHQHVDVGLPETVITQARTQADAFPQNVNRVHDVHLGTAAEQPGHPVEARAGVRVRPAQPRRVQHRQAAAVRDVGVWHDSHRLLHPVR